MYEGNRIKRYIRLRKALRTEQIFNGKTDRYYAIDSAMGRLIYGD